MKYAPTLCKKSSLVMCTKYGQDVVNLKKTPLNEITCYKLVIDND
jgi:hypothetical protein